MLKQSKSITTPSDDGSNDRSTRGLAYIRVSTQEQVEGTSLESQRERLTKWAELNDKPTPIFFSDEGISGALEDRPGLNDLLSTMRAGDIVLVTAIDRIARSSLVFQKIMEKTKAAGATFVSLREGFDTTTPSGKFGVDLMASFAEMERSMIAERTNEGRRKRHAEGKWAAGKTPYGFKRLESGFLEKIDSEATTVRLMFNHRSRGMSLGQNAHAIRDAGLRTREGGKWRTGTVALILGQSGYATGKHNSTGSRMEILVDKATYAAAERVRVKNVHMRPSAATGKPWALQNGRCMVCGKAWGVNSNRTTKRTYFCRGREHDESLDVDAPRCKTPRQPAEELDARVLEALRATLSDPVSYKVAVDTAIVRLRAREVQLARNLVPLERARATQQTRIDRLAKSYSVQSISESAYESEIADAKRKKSEIDAHINALGTADLLELERTQWLLAGAEHLSMIAARKAEIGIPMGRLSLNPAIWQTDEATEFQKAGGPLGHVSESSDPTDALREIMSRTSAEVFFYADKVEIIGYLPISIEVPFDDDEYRSSSSTSRGLR